VAELETVARAMEEADSFRVRCQRVGGFFAVPVISSSSSTEADKHKVNKRGRDEEEEVSCVCLYVCIYVYVNKTGGDVTRRRRILLVEEVSCVCMYGVWM